MATLVLTVIGNDRSGLVDALAGPIADNNGSWDRSHMARLGGQFAGIVVVTIPSANVNSLTSNFETLKAQGLLDVRVAIASSDEEVADSSLITLHLVGRDRPGIIREISNALATRRVSIEELETATNSAPMSAEPIFEATATLRMPSQMAVDELRDALEDIANELMVDLDFDVERG